MMGKLTANCYPMLTFYRDNESNFTRWVEEKLEKMVVARKIINLDENISLPEDINPNKLPVLSDGHEKWTSKGEIKEFLENLHQDIKFSRSLTSDACYIDPDNPEKCL